MRKFAAIIIGAAIAIPLLAFGSIGNGKIKTETRKVGSFSGVYMSGVGKLVLRRGPTPSVTITLDENLLPSYEAKVRGGVLRLGFEPGRSVTHVTKLRVEVVLPELEAISLSGATEAELEDLFRGSELSLDLSGAGRLEGKIDYRRLEVEISGSGRMELAGQADRIRIDLSGTGNFEGKDLEAERAEVEVSGTGRVELRVEDELSARVSGVGSVFYWGDPQVQQRISGVGKVERRR